MAKKKIVIADAEAYFRAISIAALDGPVTVTFRAFDGLLSDLVHVARERGIDVEVGTSPRKIVHPHLLVDADSTLVASVFGIPKELEEIVEKAEKLSWSRLEKELE